MSKCDYLVAIGASAGGLDPCERFFNAAPTDDGIAYVVVQHLSPDFRSLMDELLARHSSMPIHRVEDGMQVEANTIYLNRPRQILTVEDGKFVISPDEGDDILRLPIDSFFESLAQEFKEKAIGVILSGSGSDGARGARAIKSVGGSIFVQAPETAKFESMPKAVLDSKNADGSGTPEELPALIVGHITGTTQDLPRTRRRPTHDAYADILDLLQDRFGTNFQNYKPETIKRRLDRRLELAGYGTLSDYFLALLDDQSELETIYSDLLIEVTAFFRDQEAFEVIDEEVIPNICAKMSKDHQIRMWVPGCASGEEAYSLAMLVAEHARKNDLQFNLKILATDIHQRSLSAASAGIYNSQTLSKLPKEHVERYFERTGDYYQVRPNLRRAVVFSPHDLMSDPPFTRMDLVSCRNVMIYLTEEAQRKLLTLFHFSLRKGGVLFLGPSETTGKLSHEFSSISQRWRIFEKKRDVRIFDSSKVLDARRNLRGTDVLYSPSLHPIRANQPSGEHAGAISDALQDLLKLYAPPGFLINTEGQLVHIFGEGKKYLSFASGAFNSQLEDLLIEAFRPHIAPMLERFSHGIVVENSRAVTISMNDEERQFRLSLRQMKEEDGSPTGYGLFCIEEAIAVSREQLEDQLPSATDDALISSYSARVSELEHALQSNEETLQSTIEEMETSNEELQATNEELMSANEELQSTNEELHSVNEELYTVSAEHQRKIEELTEITSDMDHLLKSTNIGTIFLDSEFHVRRFTPAASKTFNLIAQDIGRPFAHVTARFTGIDIFGLATKVQETLEPVDREISADDRSYLMRILPYVPDPSFAAGVVITTIDIQDLKSAQSRIDQITQFHSEVLQDVGQLILRWGKKDGKITYCNSAFADLFELDVSDVVGKELGSVLTDPSWSTTLDAIDGIGPGANRKVVFDQKDSADNVLRLDGLVRAIGNADGVVDTYQFSGRDVTADVEYIHALERVLDVDRTIADADDARDDTDTAQEDARMGALVKIVKDYIGADAVVMTIGAMGEEDHPLLIDNIRGPSEVPSGTYEALKKSISTETGDTDSLQVITHRDASKGQPLLLLKNMHAGRAILNPIVSKNSVIGRAAFFVDAQTQTDETFTELELSLVRIVTRWIGYVWERRRRIEELQRTSAELQLIFDNVSARIWYKDDTNKILRLNKAAADSMSISVEAATGADTYDLFPEMARKYHDDDLQVIKSGKPLLGIIEKYTPKNGSQSWIRTDKIPYRDPRTGDRNLLVVTTDITDLKAREEQLHALNAELDVQREVLQKLYLDTPAMMFSTDADLEIENVNTLLLTISGYKREEMIGQAFATYFQPIDHDSLEGTAAQQYLMLCKNGETIEVEISGMDHLHPQDGMQKLWVVQDVSARNVALASLKAQNDELAKLNDGLAQFAYAASHDLQEPLRKISQYGDLLQAEHRDELGESGQYFVDVMTNSAIRMSGLIKNLLEFSSASQGELSQASVDLHILVEKAAEEYKDLIAETEAEIEIAALPKVTCDANLIQIVVTNILSNALKYRAPKRKPVVQISSLPDKDADPAYVEVTFQDNGLGFDDGDADRIFEPFARLVPKSKVPGSGIGLAICRTICERHGWTLRAGGTKGKGATFTVQIPIK